jgi:hypothetical protein
MSSTTEKIVGALLLTGVMAWGYQSWIAKPKDQKQQRNITERQAEDSQRFKDWAYVAKEKQITPGETIKLVIIPGPLGYDLFDTKCLIYTHQEFKTSSMVCPDADKDNIRESE